MPSRRLAIIATLLSLLVSVPPAFAFSAGITGYSGKPPSPSNVCNACHTGGTAPTVTFDGPSTLGTGTTGTFTFMLQSNESRQSAAGFNVAASGGTLQVVSGQKEQILPGTTEPELTHNAPKANNANGQSTWQFKWKAPTTAGNYVLWGAGNSVNLDGTSNGDSAAATTFLVAVGSGPTVTPSFTTIPSPTRTSPATASATAPPTATPTPSETPSPEPTVAQVATPTSTPPPTETPPTSPTFTPTATPTPPDTVPTPGDANCDGTVSAADVSSLVALLEGIAPLVCGGVDANQNGMLDEEDLPATIDIIFQENVVQ